MKRPLFSCVLPVKGPRPYLDEALASLRVQGMGDDLEIIVQDGDVEPDGGQSDALNKGIRLATGDVVWLVHSDGVLSEDGTLGEIAQAFHADIDAYCTGRFFRRWMFRFATFPAHPSTFVRRTCFESYGLYSLDYPICADFELMLRLFVTHRIRARYLPICTHVMRTGGLSTGGFRSNVAINRQDLRALRANGVWSCLPLIYLKYLFKVWGFVFRSA